LLLSPGSIPVHLPLNGLEEAEPAKGKTAIKRIATEMIKNIVKRFIVNLLNV
jgi:hypothetical protein